MYGPGRRAKGFNRGTLSGHELYGTDQQVGAGVAEGRIDFTAEFLLSSHLMDEEYERRLPDLGGLV